MATLDGISAGWLLGLLELELELELELDVDCTSPGVLSSTQVDRTQTGHLARPFLTPCLVHRFPSVVPIVPIIKLYLMCNQSHMPGGLDLDLDTGFWMLDHGIGPKLSSSCQAHFSYTVT